MKIKTNLYAGMTFDECAKQRDCWKNQANMMESYLYSKNTYPPAGLWFPCMGSSPCGSGSSGGTTPPPPPPPSGGGYVNGVWVPDMSGTCGYA